MSYQYIDPSELTEYEKAVACSYALHELAKLSNRVYDSDLSITLSRLSSYYDRLADEYTNEDNDRFVRWLDDLVS